MNSFGERVSIASSSPTINPFFAARSHSVGGIEEEKVARMIIFRSAAADVIKAKYVRDEKLNKLMNFIL